MTKEFQSVISLAIAGALGQCPGNIPGDIDWEKVEKLAHQHGVQPLVGYALRRFPSLACPDEVRNRMITNMRQLAVSNHMWRNITLELLSDMNRVGIPALLIKGYALASCYASPDCRLSGDADLLIPPEYEKQACTFLESRGFQVKPRWCHWHHVVCNHPVIGCVELHIQLYDNFVEEIWFDKIDADSFVLEEPIFVKSEEYEYMTLAPTDHMLFLTLHLVKHFIMAGMSLRMMIDVVLFYKENADRIDLQRFWSTIADLSFDRVVKSIFGAIALYGDMDPAGTFGIEVADLQNYELILDDLEKGGWLGHNDKQGREQSGHSFNRQLIIQSGGKSSYFRYMLVRKISRCIFYLLPPKSMLQKEYSYCDKYPLLFPLAWISYVVERFTQAIRKKAFSHGIIRENQKISDAGEDRIDLFKKMGML